MFVAERDSSLFYKFLQLETSQTSGSMDAIVYNWEELQKEEEEVPQVALEVLSRFM